MIHKFSRYLLTLVALLAMTTGAWAGGTVYTEAVAITDLKQGDILTEGASITGSGTINFVPNRVKWMDQLQTTEGFYMYPNDFESFGAEGVITLSNKTTVSPVDKDKKDGNAWEVTEVSFAESNQIYIQGTTYNATAGPEVTYDTQKTSASFAMPASDVTVSYELVRDMQDETYPVTFSGIPTGDGLILKKDGDKYTFVTNPNITLTDNISGTAQDITNAEGITLSYEKKGDGDTWVAQPDDFNIVTNATPGTYRVIAKATTGLYDGTVTSAAFTLAEAYDLTVQPANDYSKGKLASVTVGEGTEAKTATPDTDGKAVVTGIEPTKKVKITTTGSDYIIGKAAVKKAGAETAATEVIINDAKTEAEFDMPAGDATLEYDIVRNLAGKVGITVNGKQTWGETATKIQVKKEDGEYPAASTLEVSLIDILQNNATIESSNYTWKLQRLGEDGQTWQDLTLEEAKLLPGTYSIVATAKDGTLYGGGTSGEFDLVEGFEVAVPANEYITYYSEYALYTNDEDAQLYTIASVTDTEAVLSDELEVAPAETPLLIFNNSKEAKTFLLIPTDDIDLALTVAKEFKGTLEDTTIPASSTTADNYALNGLKFVWVKTALEIGANKCWIEVSKSTAKARSLNIVGGNATGISTTNYTNFTNDDIYDLQGRKVLNPTKKGIYIKNGQKVVIK